jgi:hypothetical protein
MHLIFILFNELQRIIRQLFYITNRVWLYISFIDYYLTNSHMLMLFLTIFIKYRTITTIPQPPTVLPALFQLNQVIIGEYFFIKLISS